MKILVHAPNWVGDHIMAYPFYYALKELFPKSQLYLCGRKWISTLYPKFFSEVIAFEKNKNPSLEQIKKFQELNFHLSFTLSPSYRSAIFLFKIKAKYRLGQKNFLRNIFLNFPKEKGSLRIPPPYPFEHRSLSYLRLLTPFFPNEKLAEDYLEKYRSLNIDFTLTEKLKKNPMFLRWQKQKKNNITFAICPGSVAESKVYPVEYLKKVIELFFESYPKGFVLFLGSHIEKIYAEKITKSLNPKFFRKIYDFTQETTLQEAAYLLKESQLLLANDSGLAHLSTLTQTPLISFQGMGRKEETLPLNPKKIIFHRQLPCSPCFQKKCPRKDKPLECLDIPPTEVFAAIQNLLKQTT